MSHDGGPRLLALGFFHEMTSEAREEDSIHDALGRAAYPDKQQLLTYLRTAPTLIAYFTMTHDELDATRPELGPLILRTDDMWVWRSDLAHYVDRYDVALPDEFLDHAAARSWVPPEVGSPHDR